MSDDFAANIGTTGVVAVGNSITGNIEIGGDTDWIAVRLSAGTTYSVSLRGVSSSSGLTLSDPVIDSIRDSSGNTIAGTFNDDDGTGSDALITFTPSTSGNYYIVARGFSAGTGTYNLAVTPANSTVVLPGVLPSISITPSNAPTAEGNNGVAPFTFTVTRTGDLSTASTVSWVTTGSGTNPANSTDFVGGLLPSGTVSFATGQSNATITVNVQGDINSEPNEGFVITLANPIGATLGTSSVGTALSQSVSGGFGVTENFYTLATGGGAFGMTYEMYDIPDRADIYVNGTLATSTNGFVSNAGTLTVPSSFVLSSGNQVRVVITGDTAGTAWDYTVNYQGGVQSLNFIAAGNIINDDTIVNPPIIPPPQSSFDDFVVLQTSSTAIIGAGTGNDTYLISGSMIPTGKAITVSDALGVNSIQLNNGLQIASAQVAATALKINLINGASITVLGANSFTFEAGGNSTIGINQPDLTYSQFVQNVLGTTIPASGINTSGAITIGGISANIISVNGNQVVNATAAADVFNFNAISALADAAGTTTQASISGFSIANDRLVIDLAIANSAITTIAQLNGQQGITVQTDPFAGTTLINFGNDANGGELVTLSLVGVSNPAAVQIQVI